jgi:hypothetical protein
VQGGYGTDDRYKGSFIVNRFLVDGKEFFSDDPAVASKNIPVAMVENAQVITRKSDLARLTGVDDGEEETVINLTVKKGMKNGWFGTVQGGYGTDDRYKGSFIVNRFWNDNQFTLLGNANNCNDAGFTDGNGDRFRRFGGLNGVNTTQSLGLNFNVGNAEIFRVGGNVMYSHNKRDNRNKTHRLNIFQDGNTTDDSESSSLDKGHNIGGEFRVKWQPDSFNTLEVRPNFSININDSEQFSTNSNYDASGSAISNARNIGTSHGTSYEFSGRVIYNHNFKSHRGRSFSIQGNYSMSNVHENETAWSRNAFWAVSPDSIYEDYQLIKTHTWTNAVNARLSWTEPLGNAAKGNYLEFSYSMDYRWNNTDKTVLHDPISLAPIPDEYLEWRSMQWGNWGLADRLSGLTEAGLIPDTDNSNSFRNDYFNQSIRFGYKKVSKNYTLNAGLSVNPQMSRSLNLTHSEKTIPTRWVWNYAPFLWMRYKVSRQTSFNLNYMGRSSQPSLTQLQPVADTSDPLNIVQGNPNLDPSFSHSMRLRYQTFDQDRQQSIMVMASGGFTQNAIVSNVQTDRLTGGRYTTYENVNGNWNASVFTIYSRPLPNKLFTFNNDMRLGYTQSVGYIDGSLNHSRAFSLNESFAFAFRPNDLELEIRPSYSLKNTANTIQGQVNRTVHTYGGSFNGTYYTPFGLVLASDLTYSANAGYSDGYNVKQWMWNASISYMFLSGKNATIAISANDILGQQQSIMRNETAQAITDSEYNTLGRYVMATLTYKFTTFANGNPSNRADDMMREGPPGSGMRGGMGGPGGGMGGPGGGPGGPR